jgi:hypothetical protein
MFCHIFHNPSQDGQVTGLNSCRYGFKACCYGFLFHMFSVQIMKLRYAAKLTQRI